ncbi:zinc finger protein 692-like [Pseudopipra pipra]|uniref:zinc finger protein 692-like n=1 Tax=Pseudopipra pipra TaxID=415032 RepID=UPI003138644A
MERGAAEEPLPVSPARGGRPRAPEVVRRQRRRELDARRSRCRIRIGGHLERWCRLKEQLGFALHSQLAQFLLDRYSNPGGTRSFRWVPPPPQIGMLPTRGGCLPLPKIGVLPTHLDVSAERGFLALPG